MINVVLGGTYPEGTLEKFDAALSKLSVQPQGSGF